MTLDEKLSLMAGDDLAGVFTGDPATGTSDGVARLGIPTVYYSDGPVGPREGQVTAMPGPLALASTFDPPFARRVGAAIADEVKHKGNDLVHAPTVEPMRTPLAGRTFETLRRGSVALGAHRPSSGSTARRRRASSPTSSTSPPTARRAIQALRR